MEAKLQSLLESGPYEVSTAEKLEAHLTSQLVNKTYDYQANKALLKNYQVNSTIAKEDFVCNALILSLMRLPSTDFLSLSYIVPPSMVTASSIIIVQKCADLLESGKFREFWEQFVPSHTVFSQATGFVDSVRLFIVSNLRDTFRNIPKALFQERLGLDEKSLTSFCDSNKFIEKVRVILLVLKFVSYFTLLYFAIIYLSKFWLFAHLVHDGRCAINLCYS